MGGDVPMEPESPDNERQRKIDEAIESGNHELREMARLAYNRGDKDLARNIWRSLTESQGDKPQQTGTETEASKAVPASVVLDPDLEAARRAELATQKARFSDNPPAVYASLEPANEQDSSETGTGDAVTAPDALTNIDSIRSGDIGNPAKPGSDLI